MFNSEILQGLGLASGLGGEEPIKQVATKGRQGQYDQAADARDSLANLIGFGSKTMNDDVRANYSKLITIYGQELADKLMNHVFVFNNRPDIQKSGPEDRINSFYATGSRDKQLSDIFTKLKSFGKGPIAGMNESINQGSQILSGRLPLPPIGVIPEVANAAKARIK